MKTSNVKKLSFLLLGHLLIVSCSTTVQLPKFTTIDKVVQIKHGMIRDQVELKLGISPYDIKDIDAQGSITVLYKYKVLDRKVEPDNIQPTNGKETWGYNGDLYVVYSKDEKVISVRSCLVECAAPPVSVFKRKSK